MLAAHRVLHAPAAAAGPTLLAHTSALGGANSATTSGIDTTGASLLIVAVASFNTPTLSDSAGNTFTGLTQQTAGHFSIQLFECYSPITSSSDTFTVSGANSYASLAVAAFSGTSGSAVDTSSGATDTTGSSTLQTGSITPTHNDELIVSGVTVSDWTATLSVNSGLTITDQVASASGMGAGVALAYLVQASAAAINPTWTKTGGTGTTTDFAASIGAFQ